MKHDMALKTTGACCIQLAINISERTDSELHCRD